MTKPIRVLQLICPTGFYGAERWILTLAKNLDDALVQCDLAVTVEPGFDELEITRQYRQLQKSAYTVPMKGRFDFSVIGRLCTLIKERRYDIIHSHGYKSDILGLIAARLSGVKAIATPHGFENADDWKLRAYIALGNKFLKYFDVIAPLSEQLCRDVERVGVKSSKVVYIQNGVDLDEVEAQRARGVSSSFPVKNKKRVGFIGQMISRKNIRDLLDIFDVIAQKHGDLELKLLGDGEQRAELESYAKALPSQAAIEFLGFRNDRLDWLQSFDLFVMTSTLEGIPRCLMETMAMGVPVAAYAIAGIDQLVVHGKTGLLAPLGDKQALTSHWESLLYDTDCAQRIAAQARDYVWENFSGQRMAQQYTDLFGKLLRQNR